MNFKKSNAVVQHTELNLTVKYSDQGVIRFELKPVTIGDALTQVDIENSSTLLQTATFTNRDVCLISGDRRRDLPLHHVLRGASARAERAAQPNAEAPLRLARVHLHLLPLVHHSLSVSTAD